MNIIRLDEIDSTNLYAKQHLSELGDMTVIVADRQTAGRGRFNRSWIDLGRDNIFATIVLKPSETFDEKYTNITQFLSVMMCKVFEQYGVSPSIKWPNDVLIDGKKIAGILSETVVQGQKFKGIMLGFGINLNAEKDALLNIKDKEATALNLEINSDYIDKEKFLNDLLNEFFGNYDLFLNDGFAIIKNDYLSRACFLNKEISVQVFNEQKSGYAKAINDSGELVIEKDNKELVLTMGDIL